MIPSIYATAGASGVIQKETFDYIEACFLRAVREHQAELDGIYLHLHGASEVEEIGSGEHHILAAIRQIVGPHLPIAVCCAPHGNLCREYVESTQIIRSYRESPHTDSLDTMCKVASMLCELVKARENIHAVYRKLPLILGGEQSVSTDEPVKSINQYMDELEKDPRIRSASWHVDYIATIPLWRAAVSWPYPRRRQIRSMRRRSPTRWRPMCGTSAMSFIIPV